MSHSLTLLPFRSEGHVLHVQPSHDIPSLQILLAPHMRWDSIGSNSHSLHVACNRSCDAAASAMLKAFLDAAFPTAAFIAMRTESWLVYHMQLALKSDMHWNALLDRTAIYCI